MSSTILGIGLECDLKNRISTLTRSGDHFLAAQDFQEAEPLLFSNDISTIMVDTHASTKLREDVSSLLSDTPLTTRIFLVTHPTDMVSSESYSALGIKTLPSPVSEEDLKGLVS